MFLKCKIFYLRQLALKVKNDSPPMILALAIRMVLIVNVLLIQNTKPLVNVLMASRNTREFVTRTPWYLTIQLKTNAPVRLLWWPTVVTLYSVIGRSGCIARKIVVLVLQLELEHVNQLGIQHVLLMDLSLLNQNHARFKNVSLARTMRIIAIAKSTHSA